MLAEQLGFAHAWTYDHLTWRGHRDHTWFAAVPTLTAAATATTRIRLGPLVASPNFRHPLTLAKEMIALDDISGGRVTLGVGAGGTGWDATMLGQTPWSMLNDLTERNMDMWKNLQQGFLSSVRSGAFDPEKKPDKKDAKS